MYLRKLNVLVCLIFLLLGHFLTAQSAEILAEFDSIYQSAIVQIQTDKYYESLKTMQFLKRKAIENNSTKEEAKAEGLFYLAYQSMYHFEKAEDHLLEAIRLNSVIKDTQALTYNYTNLAYHYMLIGDYGKYDKSLRKSRKLDKEDNFLTKFYQFENEVNALYKQKKFDSLVLVSKKALGDIEKVESDKVTSQNIDGKKWPDLIKERLQVTFEFYLAYGLIETKQDLALGNHLLNGVKDKKLEEILWYSPRIFKEYYRINHYKSQYFLNQGSQNLDSINYYQKKAEFYFNKTATVLEEKSGANIDYLNQMIEGEAEIERLELISKNKERESAFIRKIAYLQVFLVLLSVAFALYYRRANVRFKEINNVLDDKNTLLKELHVHRNKFLAVLSHEIRTPMYALQELITTAGDEYGKEEREEFSLANYSLINLRHAVDNSLQFSRLNFFKQSISIVDSPIIIKNLITELRGYYEPILMVSEVQLITHVDLQNKAFEFNRSKISLVLQNLIKNAIELEDVLQVRLKVEETRVSSALSKVKFSVVDDGSGISKEELDYVGRGEIIITDENTNKGIKLGLILCNQLLSLYNSKLIFESKELNNSVSFELELKPSKKFAGASPIKPKTIGRKKILYIDDNMINLVITKRIIDSLGHDCYPESSGRSALEKLMVHSYDLVLLDINMPHMDGYETSVAIHKINNTIPIIAYTALSEDEIRGKFRTSHISEVLTKPLDSNQFKRTLDKYFNYPPS